MSSRSVLSMCSREVRYRSSSRNMDVSDSVLMIKTFKQVKIFWEFSAEVYDSPRSL